MLSEGTRSYGEGNRIAEADVRILQETIEWARDDGYSDLDRLYTSGLNHILHSLTNTDRECFNRLSQSDFMKDLASHSRCSSLEILLFRVSKSLFYRIGHKARSRKFSGDSFLFDKRV